MGRNVIVLASRETERRSLPHLAAYLRDDGVTIAEIRIPPRRRSLNVEMAERLIKAIWYEMPHARPDKFVVLVDADGRDPQEVLRPFREQLAQRLRTNIDAHLQFAYAQWHLEAWFFADRSALREYLGRDLGNVDTSRPDEIGNPKLHLKHLLGGRVYTAVVSEEIAQRLNAATIAGRSPSFAGFLEAVRNGTSPQPPPAGQ